MSISYLPDSLVVVIVVCDFRTRTISELLQDAGVFYIFTFTPMRPPEYCASVFGVLRDTDGKILFLRRSNTGHYDGYLSLPAGHIEYGETASEAFVREMQKEIGITITEFHHIFSEQSIGHDCSYFNQFFEIDTYTGSVTNAEPEKCSELIWDYPSSLKKEETIDYVTFALGKIEQGERYGETRSR